VHFFVPQNAYKERANPRNSQEKICRKNAKRKRKGKMKMENESAEKTQTKKLENAKRKRKGKK